MRLYGCLQNRMEENKMFCDEIKVGTGMTEYYYSDCKAYEVIKVYDQKNVVVRLLDHIHDGSGTMDNKWRLVSNEKNPTMQLKKRGGYWYRVLTATREQCESDDAEVRLWVALNGFDISKIKEKGEARKYIRINVSFGIAQYYYDYTF